MPFVPIPRVAALDAIWTQEGQNVENTFHYHFGADITEADLEALANTYASWAGGVVVRITDVSQLVKISVRDLSSSSGLRFEQNVIPPVTGTNTSGQFPNNVTFALKRQTGLAGRANRGRIYLIGLPHQVVDATVQGMLAVQANAYVADYDALMSRQFSDNAADEVIAHKTLGTFTHVTGYAYSDLTLDSQRRRLPGHNRHH